MGEVLSQSEIDALLSAVSSGSVETASDNDGASTSSDWIAYDLTSQEKIFRGRFAGLEGIHERLSRLLRVALSTMLKKNVTVTCINTEFLKFGDYCANILLPASLNIIDVKELHGSMILIATSKLTYALVDSYYGGSERPFAKLGGKAEFTAIENRMIQKLCAATVDNLHEAWRLNYPLSFEFVRSESNPSFVGSIHASELVAVVSFDVELESLSGPFQLILPTRPLDSIHQAVSYSINTEIDEKADVWHEHWERELRSLPVEVSVQLGSTPSTLRQIESWKVGDTVALQNDVVSPLPIFVEQISKFLGVMGEIHGSTAIKIMEVVEAPAVDSAA